MSHFCVFQLFKLTVIVIAGYFLHKLMMKVSPDFFRYASSFRFSGDYVHERDVGTLGKRKTRIVAIDALCSPGMRQYRANFVLRFVNLGLSCHIFAGGRVNV